MAAPIGNRNASQAGVVKQGAEISADLSAPLGLRLATATRAPPADGAAFSCAYVAVQVKVSVCPPTVI